MANDTFVNVPVQDLVTPGFVEAVRDWGQYLAGQRDWGWGAYCARTFLRMCGLQEPANAPTEQVVRGLAKLANQPALFKLGDQSGRGANVLDGDVIAAGLYLNGECDVNLVDGGTGQVAVSTFDEVIGQAGGLVDPIYVDPPARPAADPNYWDSLDSLVLVYHDADGNELPINEQVESSITDDELAQLAGQSFEEFSAQAQGEVE